jgi:replicative DNA helicase
MNNLQIEIEQKVLCSMLADNVTLDQHIKNVALLNKLETKDFTLEAHQELLKAFKLLESNNKPLESVYIEDRLNPKYRSFYINILCQSALANLEDYIQLLKERRAKRELKLTAVKLVNDKELNLNDVVDQIQNLQNISSQTTTKSFDDSFLSSTELEKEDIEKSNFEYLIDNFIVKAELMMIAAKPGSGKSLTTVAIANQALIDKKVDKVLYFDLDNSTTTLKQRNIHLLKDTHGDAFRYIHSSKVSRAEVFRYIKQFQNMDLTNKLFVFDSAKNFMNGGDRDKNKDVSKLLDEFKKLRDKGATVIFLHHTNKPSKDLEGLIYAGSSAWEEDTTNAYMLDKNEHKNSFIFKNFKSRVGELKDFAFKYNENHTLTTLALNEASVTEEDEEIIDEIKSYLLENTRDPMQRTYTKILFTIQKLGYAKNKVASVMKRFIDINWSAVKQTENNRTVYTLLNQPIQKREFNKEPVVTTFNYLQNHEKTLDKSDNPDKSILSGIEQSDNLRISADKYPVLFDNSNYINNAYHIEVEIPYIE